MKQTMFIGALTSMHQMDCINLRCLCHPQNYLIQSIFLKMDIDLTCSISKVELYVQLKNSTGEMQEHILCQQILACPLTEDLMNKLQPDYLITPCARSAFSDDKGTRIKRFM